MGNNIKEISFSVYVSNCEISFEFRLFDKNGIPLLFFSPRHSTGKVEDFKIGNFDLTYIVNLPKEIHKVIIMVQFT